MPLPAEIQQELSIKYARAHEEAHGDMVRDLMRAAVLCVVWMLLGLFSIAWAFHTTDLVYGKMAFFAGIAIGNGGILFTLMAAYRRGEKRGDW